MSMQLWQEIHEVLCLDQEVGQTDATTIEPLNEDTLIANLHQRFKRDQIYTYIGTMVIAVNPYKKLSFYSAEVIAAYQHHSIIDLPPHIYAIAEHIFQSMKDKNQDQCIIITGESGSGKTESAKIALQYLIYGSSQRRCLEYLKEQLLSLNSVLEAFGNAITLHNNNSSRFGMFLEIEFDFKGDPMGANITKYLLEKSRVVKQSVGERNFHIFYQLLNGTDLHLLKFLKLQRNSDNYSILSASHSSKNEEICDKNDFLITKKAMETIGFTPEDIVSIFQIISAVLKLGNLQFIPRANIDGTEGCSIVNEYELYDVCELLMSDMSALETSFTQRIIETRHELLVADLCSVEAKKTRDALCKALYNRLFTWMVTKINELIKAKILCKRKSVGILDVYGFEVFEKNYYEQFLINYCNEKLHQIFIDLTLKYEQEEYQREGIQWKKIDFFNNHIICELIEKNNHGILSMLEEECLKPTPINDELFLQDLTKEFQDSPYFESSKHHYESHGCKNFVVVPHLNISCEPHNPGSSSSLPQHCFRLRHFAGTVTYSVNGFVDKNNDILYRDLSYVMFQSEHPLLKVLFPEGNPYRTQIKRPATIATQFKISISALMKNIHSKQINFIKCIKPNAMKEPQVFETPLVQHQIRCQLLVEFCRLRRAGYFFREDYESFLKRYKMLSNTTWPQWNGTSIEGVTYLLKQIPIPSSEFAFGKSKIFIRSLGMSIELDEYRTLRLHELATLIQKVWRGWTHRKFFTQLVICQRIIAKNYKTWKRKRYLLWLAKRLPPPSPLFRDWPSAPRSLQQTNYLLRKLYHKWRCQKYRQRFDQTARNRMREKVTASLIFRDRKSSYKKSVSHPFRGDYVRLRQSVRWKRCSNELGDQYVVFADIINKITKTGGKFVQKLIVISTSAMIILDQRTMQCKYRIPVTHIYRVSLSPYMDDIVVIHTCSDETRPTEQNKAFVLESAHVIEIVTKLFLVIQNASGKPPEVQISNEFEANFGKDIVTFIFKCCGPPDTVTGPAKIHRRGNKLEITL